MAEALLKATGIARSFVTPRRRVEVLRGCDLALAPGDSLPFLGSRGSGKSTLLHILGTLDRPDEGSLAYGGRELLKLGSREMTVFRGRELGFVFQFHHRLPEFSALENVGLPLLIQGLAREQAFARSRQLLETLGMGSRAEHRPDELSGGEQQRVAVARALVHDPRLILADEPTGNLDEVTGRELADLLFRYRAEEGLALVLVTHDAELAARCDRTLRLEEGILGVS
mgnify:CR=1 FL=1